jgi:hypothetical protein
MTRFGVEVWSGNFQQGADLKGWLERVQSLYRNSGSGNGGDVLQFLQLGLYRGAPNSTSIEATIALSNIHILCGSVIFSDARVKATIAEGDVPGLRFYSAGETVPQCSHRQQLRPSRRELQTRRGPPVVERARDENSSRGRVIDFQVDPVG